MRKFVIRILFFFLLVGIVDFCAGLGFDYMNAHAKGGSTKQFYDLCMNSKYDVLILGSSRACHHYVPTIISDSLGVSTYNAGQDGNGVLLAYGIYGLITNRYKPRLIIFDVEPSFDIIKYNNDNGHTRYLSLQKPFYRDTSVKEVIEAVSKEEYIKTHSALYRYNGKISILYDFLIGRGINKQGYIPLIGGMTTERASQNSSQTAYTLDSLKLCFVKKLIEATKEQDIPLLIVASPKYGSIDSSIFLNVKQYCEEYGVPFCDYYTDSLFMNHPDWFKEPMHLNHKGAIVFTTAIIPEIRKALSNIKISNNNID